jgi:hypothetical protein
MRKLLPLQRDDVVRAHRARLGRALQGALFRPFPHALSIPMIRSNSAITCGIP